MRWQGVEPVQTVDGLLIRQADALAKLRAVLLARPAAIRQLPVAGGDGWAVVLARPGDEPDAGDLPFIKGARALYRAAPGWWFPVGLALDVPAHALAEVLGDFTRARALPRSLVAAPASFDQSQGFDIYPVGTARAIDAGGLP